MNHLTTDDFINRLLYSYWEQLDKAQSPYRDEYISNLQNYFQNRKPFIFKQIEADFPSAPARTCTVSANSYPIIVDGYIKTKPYQGSYFPGATLTVSSEEKTLPNYWLVNESVVDTQEVVLTVSENEECQIRAVF